MTSKKTPHNSTLLPTLAVTIGAAIWGVYWIPLRYAEHLGMSGPWAVVLASVLPLFALIPMSCWYWQSIRPEIKTIVLIGFFTGAALSFYGMGLVYTTVIRATLLFYLTPVWSTLFSIVLLREEVHWNRWAAILLGLIGLYFILGGASDLSTPLNIGDFFGLISGIFWGVGAIFLKKNPSTTITGSVTIQHIFSFLIALGCCLVLPEIDIIPERAVWVSATPVMWAYSWLGLVPSLFALFWASGKLFPGRVGILMMTEALVAVISASILLDEQIQMVEWFGVLLILSAGILEIYGSDNHPEELP